MGAASISLRSDIVRLLVREWTIAAESDCTHFGVMNMDPKKVRKRVAQRMGVRAIPDPVWREVVRERYLEDLQANPGFSGEAFRDLLASVRRKLRMVRDTQGYSPPWSGDTPTIDSAFTPYVTLMTQALHEPSETPWGPIHPDVIRGSYRAGRIRIEAEPWVPAASVERLYREMQGLVLRSRRNESVLESTLRRFLWLRDRRRSKRETWDETRRAWEKAGGPKYTSTSQIRRDYSRTKAFIERVRKFRHEAMRLQTELG